MNAEELEQKERAELLRVAIELDEIDREEPRRDRQTNAILPSQIWGRYLRQYGRWLESVRVLDGHPGRV